MTCFLEPGTQNTNGSNSRLVPLVGARPITQSILRRFCKKKRFIWATKAVQSTKKGRGDSNLWPIIHNTSILTTRPRHPWYYWGLCSLIKCQQFISLRSFPFLSLPPVQIVIFNKSTTTVASSNKLCFSIRLQNDVNIYHLKSILLYRILFFHGSLIRILKLAVLVSSTILIGRRSRQRLGGDREFGGLIIN